MSETLRYFARKNICAMQAYQPGKPIEEAQRELGLTTMVKLASNENPRGPSPVVCEAMRTSLAGVNLYPDANGFYLKQVLAEKHGVSPAQITLGNGSNDVLELVASVFLDEHSSAVFSEYGFLVYALAVARVGAQAIEVAASGYAHDIEAMSVAVRPDTRVIYIANPNNPTGTYATVSAIRGLLESVSPDVLVVLDEAYSEYIDRPDYPDGIALLREYDNLLIARTFSKAYGLAGLRVGYSVSSEAVAGLLNRVRMPFNVSNIGLVAAQAALADSEFLAESVALNHSGRQQLCDGLQSLGVGFIPSVANFLMFDVRRVRGKNAADVYQALLECGVIVRPLANYGLAYHLRVSVGLDSENARFLEMLGALCSG